MGRQEYFEWRYANYFRTYEEHFRLTSKIDGHGNWIREWFLYQEPNPKYDWWLPENCTPVNIKEWLRDKVPPEIREIKPREKSVQGWIRPRPIVCIETGQFYWSVKDCKKEHNYHCYQAASGKGLFAGNERFTWVDPFLPFDDEEYIDDFDVIKEPEYWAKGRIHKTYNPNSSNRAVPVMIVETGEFFDKKTDAKQAIADRLGVNIKTVERQLRDGTCEFHLRRTRWS